MESRRWPWAEIEPVLGVEDGVGDVVAGLRSAVGRVGDAAICELSGGQDSRLCLALLVERGAEVLALTGDEDLGHDREQRVAARVAAAAGVDHEIVTAAPERYWDDLQTHAERVDYAFVRSPWRIPMLPVMRSAPGTVVDGFGFDTLAGPGDRFFTPEALDPGGGDGAVRALWTGLARGRPRPGSRGLVPELADACGPGRGPAHRLVHPAPRPPLRAVLTFYLARQVRGISLGPICLLGADAPVAIPLVDDEVARATLAISFQAKQAHRLYDAFWAKLAGPLGTLPTTRRGDAEEGAQRPRRSQSPVVADAFAACLAEGPLTPLSRAGQARGPPPPSPRSRGAGSARAPRAGVLPPLAPPLPRSVA